MEELHLFPGGHLQHQGNARQKKLLRAGSLHLPESTSIGEETSTVELPLILSEELCKSSPSTNFDTPSTACSPQNKSGSGYYDIPTPENAPEIERKICDYLAVHNIHISHPSMRSGSFKPIERSLSGTLLRRKSLILERRTARAPSDFVVTPLIIATKTSQPLQATNP